MVPATAGRKQNGGDTRSARGMEWRSLERHRNCERGVERQVHRFAGFVERAHRSAWRKVESGGASRRGPRILLLDGTLRRSCPRGHKAESSRSAIESDL